MAPPHTVQFAGRAERALMTTVHNALRRDLDQLPHTTASPVIEPPAAATGMLLPGPTVGTGCGGSP